MQGHGGPRASDLALSFDVAGADDGRISAGEELSVTLRYANQGEQPAPDSAVTLTLGSGLSLRGAIPAPTGTHGATSATWELGELAPGASGEITDWSAM